MPNLKDFDNLDESKLPTILKNKLSDRLKDDTSQLFEVSDDEDSEEQNNGSGTDKELSSNSKEISPVHGDRPEESILQNPKTSREEEELIPKTES